VQLGAKIDWDWIDREIALLQREGPAGDRTVDTTVQPKAISDRRQALPWRSRGSTAWPVRYGLKLRQSYLRIAKQAAMMAGRMPSPNSSNAIVGN
jgi:hypothetical protein